MRRINIRPAAGVEPMPSGPVSAAGETGSNGDPSGNGGAGSTGPILIDPSTLIEPGDGGGSNGSGDGIVAGSAPKRRGRKPGSRNTTSGKAASLSIDGLSSILLSIHAMGAALTRVPQLELDKSEADQLAVATAAVMRHYPSFSPAPQVVDWIGLMSALGIVYGPRLMAIRIERAKAKRTPSLNELREAAGNPPKPQAASMAQPAPAPAPVPQQANGAAPTMQVEIPGLPGVKITRSIN